MKKQTVYANEQKKVLSMPRRIVATLLFVCTFLSLFVSVTLAAGYGHDYVADAASPVEGETFRVYGNYENIAAGTTYSSTAQSSPKGNDKTTNMTIWAGSNNYMYDDTHEGTISVGSQTNNGLTNKFLQVSIESKGLKTTHQTFGADIANSTHSNTDTAFSFLNTQYYVLDADIFFPKGTLEGATMIGMLPRTYNASNARSALYNATAANSLGYTGTQYYARFEQSGDDIVIKGSKDANGYTSAVATVKPDQWTHVTIIIEGVLVERTSSSSGYGVDLKCYLAINGEIVHTYTFAAPDNSYADKFYNKDMSDIYIQDARWIFGTSGGTICTDNIAFRTYARDTYKGNLSTTLGGVGTGSTDITGWDRNAYDPDTMPFGNTVAKIGDVEYDSLAKAVKAAEDGDTIEMQRDSAENIVIDKKLTINLNGKTVTGVTAAAGFELVTSAENIVVQVAKASAVANIGGVEYTSLAAAVEAAKDGDTITLMADIDESITIGKAVTIAYNSHTAPGITIAAGYCQSTTAEQLVIKAALYEITDKDGNVTYSDGDFKTTIQNATVSSVVKLLQDIDYTSTAYISIYRNCTLDLNGHTLNITQGVTSATKAEFLINNKNVTFTVKSSGDKRGTINVTNDSTYHVFRTNNTGAKLVLSNLNVTSGSLIYSTFEGFTVELENSAFNISKAGGNGFIESLNTTAFTANGCKFYASATNLIRSQAIAGATADTFSSTFNFTDCDIYRDAMDANNPTVRKNIFTVINAYTHVTFSGNCNIAGSLMPATNSTERDNGIPAMTAANIILGVGTKLSADSEYTATADDGLSIIPDGVTQYTFKMTGIEDITYTVGYFVGKNVVANIGGVEYPSLAAAVEAAKNGDTITLMADIDEELTIGKEITIAYNSHTVTGITIAAGYCQSTTAEQLVIKAALYEITDKDGNVTYSDGDFKTTIQNATVSSVVKLLQDIDYTSTAYISIYRNCTLDLNGHTLNITQGVTSATKAEFLINNKNVTFTVKSSGDKRGTINVTNDSTYHVFRTNNTGAKLVLSNLNVTSGSLIYSAFESFTVELENSNFNISKAGGNGFIESLNTTAFTANGCKFYASATNLIRSQAIAGATAETFRSTFDFTDCDIYRDAMDANNPAVRKNIFTVINAYTHVTFSGNCNIAGSLMPATNSTERDNGIPAMTAANIILGVGTKLSADSEYTATADDGLSIIPDGVTQYTFKMTGIDDITYTVGYFVGKNVVANIGGVEYSSLAAAVEAAKDGDTIEMQKNSAENIVIDKELTINLNGKTVTGVTAADGFELVTSAENIVVQVAKAPAVANIGGVEYTSLAAAVEAAKDGDTITLMANIDEELTIGKEITIAYNSHTVTGITIAAGYCQSVSTTAEQLVIKAALYEITDKDDNVTYSDGDFKTTIQNATVSSVVKLLQDIDYTSTAYISIYRNCTLDLNGHTLNITQGVTSATKAEFLINNKNVTFTVKSSGDKRGTINVTNDSTYHVFRTNNTGAKLVLSNLNVTSGSLIYSSFEGFTVELENSAFNISKAGGNGFIESLNTTAFTANGCKFYASATNLIRSQAIAGATADTFSSTFNFTDCDIYRDAMDANNPTVRKNIFTVINAYTHVTFSGNCNIAGSLMPATNSTERDNGIPAMTAANIILGVGTKLSADSEYTASFPENYDALSDSSDYTFAIPGFVISYKNGVLVGPKNFTVTWYKEDGKTVIKTYSAPYGTTGVEAPTYTPGDNNGWYKTGFDGWTATNGSSVKVDLASFVVNGDVAFYPAVKIDAAPTPYLSSAEYNLTLTGNITINFYLPMSPEGITVIGVFESDGTSEIVGKEVILPDGQHRMMYVVGTVGAIELTEKTVIKVKFTVAQNGNEYDLIQTVTLSPYKYATSVLGSNSHTEETRTLVADMVRYSNVLAETVTGNTVKELDALLETYGDLCSELPSDNDFCEFNTSVVDLKGYINTISLEVSEYQPRWRFTFTEAMKITDVKITLNGYYELPDANKCNYGTLTYKLNTTDSTKTGGYYTTVYMENIPMYNVDRVITITVTTEDGIVKSGTYSLNNYFANMNAEGEELANARAFLKAFRAFGITSAGYRYPDGMKPAGAPTKDFFDCKHEDVEPIISGTNMNDGALCPDCGTRVFFYEVFLRNYAKNTLGIDEFALLFDSRDAALSAAINVYPQIYLCHSKANAAAAAGNKVGVYAGDYYFYLEEARLSSSKTYNTGEIAVRTDTNWEGAYFIIDDQRFGVEDKTYKTPVFTVRGATSVTAPDGNQYAEGGTDITQNIVDALSAKEDECVITPGMKNIGWSCGMPMLVELIDYSQSRYHREGANESKLATREVILIDEFGNVNSTTPIEWDYIYNSDFNGIIPSTEGTDEEVEVACSFKATAYPINAAPIKLSGLDQDGNISCVFETLPNETNIDMSEYNACLRGIYVRSSNVTVEGLEHIMNEDDDNTTPRQAYDGFIRVAYANNTVIKDMLVDNPVRQYIKDENGVNTDTGIGSYEFAGNNSVNTSWINCAAKDFFGADGSINGNGLFGTNRMRNSYVKNCTINSFDSHTGAYNVTIEDSTLEHISLIGAGDIVLKNVVVYVDATYGGISLRGDYGSRWEGNVYIDGLDLRHSDSYDKNYVDLVKAEYRDYDFGYADTTSTSGNYLPFEIYANNVTIHSYDRETQYYTCTVPGIIDEVLEKSTIKLGIYATYDETLAERYPTLGFGDDNKQEITKAIYLEGGDISSTADLYLPSHYRLSGIEIYINGVEQSW